MKNIIRIGDKMTNEQILPVLSQQLLERRAAQQRTQGVRLGYCDDEGISLHFINGPNTVQSVVEEA